MRILVASPVRQSPAILRAFLDGLEDLRTEGHEITWLFVDDNDTPVSSQMLYDWVPTSGGVDLWLPVDRDLEPYVRDETTHRWTETLWMHMADVKDQIIEHTLESGYDGLLLVDSDLVLHPDTLSWLMAAKKPVVSEIFWTSWTPDQPPLPNVWHNGVYRLWAQLPGDQLPQEEQLRRAEAWLTRLQRPGLYPVGGLGACTLISREALEKGARYAIIPNLDYWGEDRHFCVRTMALGIELWVDTHVPPLHLYRESDLERMEPRDSATEASRR